MPRYSNDLRKLFADKINQGLSIATIQKELNIGEDTAYKWRLKMIDGTLFNIIRSGGHAPTYDYAGLQAYLELYPDKMLYEIKDEFFNGKASISGIDKALKRMKFRLKKSPPIQRKK